MFNFIGFSLMILFGGAYVLDKFLDFLRVSKPETLDLLKGPANRYAILGFVVGALIVFNPFVYNADGERTYVLDRMTGNEKVIYAPGFAWGGFYVRTVPWPDVMSTAFDRETAVEIRFNDATQATAEANVRWELPKDEVLMINLHKSYRSPEALQSRTLEPYSRECLAFAAQLMESETHYSGGQSKLKEDFRDQLLNGQYVLETNTSFVYDSIQNERVKITEVDLRRDDAGQAIRIPSDVQTYGIRAVFAAVPRVDYDTIVDEKLQAKIEQSTKESIAKQTLITSEQEALTAAAEGRKLVAQTKAKYEAQKEQAVIEAQKAKDVAREDAMRAKFIADRIEQEGRAKAAANQALVTAGLTPQDRAEWEYKKHVDGMRALADGIARANWPRVMSFGQNTSVTNPIEAIGLKSILEITDRMDSPKKK